MSDNKKYYYLKLKDNFFDSPEIVVLQSEPDGYKYSDILLKLYLHSLQGEGRVMLNDRIPFNPKLLGQLTRHDTSTVEAALGRFRELGLIDVLDTGAIYMLAIQQLAGRPSTEVDKQALRGDSNGDN